MPEHGLAERLVAAVTARDTGAARSQLLSKPAPTPIPRALTASWCSAFAVAGFDHETAEALTDGGTDPDRELPDGTTQLLRTVDLGSYAVVSAVLGNDPQMRIPEPARRRLLDLARHWFETGRRNCAGEREPRARPPAASSTTSGGRTSRRSPSAGSAPAPAQRDPTGTSVRSDPPTHPVSLGARTEGLQFGLHSPPFSDVR